jgi:hypothetical protein
MRREETLIALFRYRNQRRRVFAQGGSALEAMLAEDAERRLIIRNDIRKHDEGCHSEANVMCRSHYCLTRRQSIDCMPSSYHGLKGSRVAAVCGDEGLT